MYRFDHTLDDQQIAEEDGDKLRLTLQSTAASFCNASDTLIAFWSSLLIDVKQFKTEFEVGSIYLILDLIKVLVEDIPNYLKYGIDPDFTNIDYPSLPHQDAVRFYYHFMRRFWTNCSRMEYNIDYEGRYIPIVPYLGHALMPGNQITVTLDNMKKGNHNILLSYSGGKESQLIKGFFDDQQIPYVPVGIYDTYQSANLEDYSECVKTGNWQHVNDIEHILMGQINVTPSSAFTKLCYPVSLREYDKYGSMAFFPIVSMQRLLVLLYAELQGFDLIAVGDEAERSQIYSLSSEEANKSDPIYVARGWLQTTQHYTILNSLLKSVNKNAPQLFSPITNVMQPQILAWAVRNKIQLNSCWTYHNEWCNQCAKCVRIGTIFQHFKKCQPDLDLSLYTNRGLQVEGHPEIDSETNFHSLLGVAGWKTTVGPDKQYLKPVFKDLDELICQLSTYDYSEADIPYYSNPLMDTLDEAGLIALLDFIAR